MKRASKIALWVVGCFLAVILIGIISVDTWVSRVVHKELAASMAKIPEIDASVGRVHVLLVSGTAVVKDIHFATCVFANKADTDSVPLEPGFRLDIPTLSVGPVNYIKFLRTKKLNIFNITVDEPNMTFYFDEKHPEKSFPVFPKDTNVSQVDKWLERIDLKHLHLNKICGHIKSTKTKLDMQLDSLTLAAGDFAFQLTDTTFSYNDSSYYVGLRSFRVNLPDGTGCAEVHRLETEDQGPLKLGYTRFRNTIPVLALADRMKEPTTWIDIELKSVKTSAFNPIRKALAADYTLDSIAADVKRLQVKRDERHAPKVPFPTPQEFLRKLPVVFDIKGVSARVEKLDIELYLQRENCGEMHLQNMRANLANVTNRRGATWYNKARGPIGEKGSVEAEFNMHMDKASTFDVHLNAKHIEASFLTPFIRPLVGLSMDCHINELAANYSGDDKIAKGDFCMLYDGLVIQAHKEDKVPFSIVTEHANTITNVANTLLTKSNPTVVDIKPRKYSVEWKRDEWKEYPLYIFGPCIMGTVQTLLPGLYVHKQI